jgi:peptidoglycan/LPS O-acetylase OafA/YrhL
MGMIALRTTHFIRSLTGLRALAAFWVLLYHYAKASKWVVPLVGPVVQHGYYGVDLFFVLSGFIIQHVYHRRFNTEIQQVRYLDYIRNRFARIYPIFLFSLIAMLVLLEIIDYPRHAAYSADTLMLNLFLLHGWFDRESPNIPSWSVSAEWFAYLLYPVIAFYIVRFGSWPRIALAIGCLVVLFFLSTSHPLCRIAPEFTIGMLAYDVHERVRLRQTVERFGGWMAAALILAPRLRGRRPGSHEPARRLQAGS